MNPDDNVAYRELLVHRTNLAVAQAISSYELHGMTVDTIDMHASYQSDHLVAKLVVHVMGADLEPVVGKVNVDLPLKPWWIPSFLWRRVPTHRARFTVAADVRELYPHAPQLLPESRYGKAYVAVMNGRENW